MNRTDFIGYILETKNKNNNFKVVLETIAFKYGITIGNGKHSFPKMKHTKKFLCKKCFEYFEVNITLKQISYLERPRNGKFPYTAIIIIEALYNLLKEDRHGNEWKQQLEDYVIATNGQKIDYEIFLLGDIPARMSNRVDEYMVSKYKDIFECFIGSRERFVETFKEISMYEQCEKNFPNKIFTKAIIPEKIYAYQEQRIYIRGN